MSGDSSEISRGRSLLHRQYLAGFIGLRFAVLTGLGGVNIASENTEMALNPCTTSFTKFIFDFPA
jgi:hypothetical protein